MSQNVTNVIVPAVCTRGIILFPGQDVMIEVGRAKSIAAVNEATNSYASYSATNTARPHSATEG